MADTAVTQKELLEALDNLRASFDASIEEMAARVDEIIDRVDKIADRVENLGRRLEATKTLASAKGSLLSDEHQRVLDGFVVYGPGSRQK